MSNRRKIKAAPEDAFRAYTGAYQCGHCPGGLRHGPDGWGVYHSEGCPVGAGVIAAGAAGRRAAAAASEQTGVPVMHGSFARHAEENVISGPVEKPNGPRAESIVRWFIGRQAAGALGYCGHIDPGVPGMPPGRGWWAAWDREIIRCQACHLAAEQRLNQTRDDNVCDYCRQFVPAPAAGGLRMYSMTVPLPGEMTVRLGLCPACWDADGADSAAAGS